MPKEANFSKKGEARTKVYESLRERSRNLGQIMRSNPKFQSNSPELYLLAYLKELGSAEI